MYIITKHENIHLVKRICHIANLRYYSNFYLQSPSIFACTSEKNTHLRWLLNQKRSYSTEEIMKSIGLTHANWFQALSNSSAVEKIMNGLQAFHNTTNLPWWATVIISTLLLRTVITFPLLAYQNVILARIENLKSEMNELIKELKGETAFAIKKFNWDQRHARSMYNHSVKKIWKGLIVRDNCHPVKASLLILVQIPLWIFLSISWRNFVHMLPHNDINAQTIFLELSTGGIGWIPNLTVIDASYILPVFMGLTNLANIELNACSRPNPTKLQVVLTNTFRCVSLVVIPVAAGVPACVVLYWTVSSVGALLQNLLIMHPKLRRKCGIPLTPSEQSHPYKYAWVNFNGKFKSKIPEI